MAMLTTTRGPFYSSELRYRAKAETANAHLAIIKRFCVCALLALLAGGAVTGIMALKTAAY
jgi:hypothetical protein